MKSSRGEEEAEGDSGNIFRRLKKKGLETEIYTGGRVEWVGIKHAKKWMKPQNKGV